MKGKIIKTRVIHYCERCHTSIAKGSEAIQALGDWVITNEFYEKGYYRREYYCMKCFNNCYRIKSKDYFGNFTAYSINNK